MGDSGDRDKFGTDSQSLVEGDSVLATSWIVRDRGQSFKAEVATRPWWSISALNDALRIHLSGELLTLRRDGYHSMLGVFADGTPIEFARNRLGTPRPDPNNLRIHDPRLQAVYAGRIAVGGDRLEWRPDLTFDRLYVDRPDSQHVAVVQNLHSRVTRIQWLKANIEDKVRMAILIAPIAIPRIAAMPRWRRFETV